MDAKELCEELGYAPRDDQSDLLMTVPVAALQEVLRSMPAASGDATELLKRILGLKTASKDGLTLRELVPNEADAVVFIGNRGQSCVAYMRRGDRAYDLPVKWEARYNAPKTNDLIGLSIHAGYTKKEWADAMAEEQASG